MGERTPQHAAGFDGVGVLCAENEPVFDLIVQDENHRASYPPDHVGDDPFVEASDSLILEHHPAAVGEI